MDESDLEFNKRCVAERKLIWTHHVTVRLRQHAISRSMVRDNIGSSRIIEQYREDPRSRYLPCCLVLSEYRGEPIHVLFALDRLGDSVTIVTVYRPDPAQWEPRFTKRRQE